MLIDNFAITREDDVVGGPGAAVLGGTSSSLSAAESVGIVGGRPAPTPAAADPGPNRPDADDGPDPGGTWLAPERPAMGSGSGERPVPRPDEAAGPSVPGDHDEQPVSLLDDRRFASLGLGEAAVDRFVQDYLQMLDGRLDSIRRCLADSDIEGARVAVLSLESSSKMLGGDALASRLGELRHQLDLGAPPHRNALLALAESAAAAFRTHLESVDHG